MATAKRILTLIVLGVFILFVYDGKAQRKLQPTIGVKAGVNMASLNGDDAKMTMGGNNVVDASSKLAAAFGGFVTYKFSEQFAVQPEVLLSMKGTVFDADEYVQTWSLWYLEVPVLFKSVFQMKRDIEGGVYAGPAVAYNLKATWTKEINDNTEVDGEELKQINSLDFGACVGADFNMRALGGKLYLDLRYTYGLVNIQENVSVSNGVLSAMVGYAFPLNEL